MREIWGTSSLQEELLSQYLREIHRYETLSLEEERDLSESIREGDMKARDALVRSNLGFVVSVAREYVGKGMSLLDLICEGNVGLLRATEKYDGRKGIRFISYAVWWIRHAIREALCQQTRMVRLPMSRVGALMQIGRASRELEQEYGRSATAEEISEEIGIGEDQIRDTLVMSRNSVSLDALWREEDGRCLLEVVGDGHRSPEEEAMDRALGEDLEVVLSSLGGRQAEVLRLYFGLGGREKLTLEKIAGRYGLTRERVRQIKEEALARLRHRVRRDRLEPYLEG